MPNALSGTRRADRPPARPHPSSSSDARVTHGGVVGGLERRARGARRAQAGRARAIPRARSRRQGMPARRRRPGSVPASTQSGAGSPARRRLVARGDLLVESDEVSARRRSSRSSSSTVARRSSSIGRTTYGHGRGGHRPDASTAAGRSGPRRRSQRVLGGDLWKQQVAEVGDIERADDPDDARAARALGTACGRRPPTLVLPIAPSADPWIAARSEIRRARTMRAPWRRRRAARTRRAHATTASRPAGVTAVRPGPARSAGPASPRPAARPSPSPRPS